MPAPEPAPLDLLVDRLRHLLGLAPRPQPIVVPIPVGQDRRRRPR